ncbi:MAG: CDP-glycerol glycerophosphotransferase family protein [Paludibacteraceae bacterium]|nr:CDP-glycerol glycerophosphotransferase family protein [Paludibacteraceae bacterium]
MREKLIFFLKTHPSIIRAIWGLARGLLAMFIKVSKQQKTILFCSFGGRSFNDSPRAIYNEICRREEFNDWRLVWAFVEPNKFTIPRGEKVKVDTISFFKALITSKVWVSNSGMDRGVDLITDKIIRVETWHGTPLKRICGEENQTSIGGEKYTQTGCIDSFTIRCSQSEFDREIFARIFHASKESILLSDLPRNDELFTYTQERLSEIRESLGIANGQIVILYTPTYREYLRNKNSQNYIAPPIDLDKWEKELGSGYKVSAVPHDSGQGKESDFLS